VAEIKEVVAEEAQVLLEQLGTHQVMAVMV
jgi:hypothetical protein